MTPSQRRRDGKPVGTFAFDRHFRGIGRFRAASGTTDRKVFKLIDAMLTQLYQSGRFDLLKAMMPPAPKVPAPMSVLQVYDAYRMGELDRLPSVDQLIPLRSALEKFAETYECSAKHRETLWTLHRKVDALAPAGATVATLPEVLKALRVSLAETPTMFNRLRSVSQTFARFHYGKYSKLWQRIAETPNLKVSPKRIKHPVTVQEMVELCAKLPATIWRDGVEGPCDFAGMAWTLATTGMRTIVEYFNVEWEQKAGWVEIGTGKKDKAVRRVPLVREPIVPDCDYQVFADRVRVASDGQMTPYDFRRTYANWLEAAGVPRTRRILYLGHGAIDITGRYEWHEVKAYLAEDGQKMKAWLDAEIAKAEAEKKAKAKGGLRVLK